MATEGAIRQLQSAVAERSEHVVGALRELDDDALCSPSGLPDWTRLTIACHLRYGAEALVAMTRHALEGRAAAYYPGGRPSQRPGTLVPRPGERPADVVASLEASSRALRQAWQAVRASDWERAIEEPPDNVDLGPLPLASLPLLRLTEVEVHGSDLGLGLEDWSDTFIDAALQFRLERLIGRRSTYRSVDDAHQGDWLLVARGGPTYLVSLKGLTATSRPCEETITARSVISGSRRDVLSLLLGRRTVALQVTGDVAFGRAFGRAFPGP